MRSLVNRMAGFLRELRRRRVYGVAAIAAAVAWGVIEVASVVLPTFHAPEWILQVVVVLAITGVVLAVSLAWIYKLGPEGIEKDVSVPEPLVAPASDADPHRRSIVVLPFADRAADDEGQYISDGLTELLIARLAGIHAMSVISRTTAMQYRDTDRKIPQIAGELNVTHLIEGSVLRAGEQLQIVVQLIDGRTDRHVWAETYTRSTGDLLNLMNEIAGTVAQEVKVKLRPEEVARLARSETIDPAALDAYLKGGHHLSRRTAASFEKALACFHESIDIAPQFALPYTGIADTHIMSGLYGFRPPKESFPLALANAEKAVQLDPEGAAAHTSRGSVRMFHDWDFAGAEEDYLRAIELNPSYATTHLAYGDLLWVFERGDEALEQIREAVRLDPLDLGMNMNLGDFLYFGGRFEDSAEQHRKVLAMNPQFFPSQARLAKALACAGDRDGALDALDELRELAPEAVFLETAAVTHGILGETDEARAALDDWRGLSTGYVSPLPVAWAYGALGDRDAAIEWLEKSLDERSPALIVSHVQPAFRSLADDPRYQGILKRIGIPSRSAAMVPEGILRGYDHTPCPT